MKKRMYFAVSVLLVIVILVGMGYRQVKIYKNAGSIYHVKGNEERLHQKYEQQLKEWPVVYEQRFIDNEYGQMHVIECGNKDGHDLILFHAASVGSVSWKNNIETLSEDYHIFCVDTFGEGNLTQLNDVEVYPDTEEKVVTMYHELFEVLEVEKPYIAGASYGGYLALIYAKNYPDNVEKIALFGPMGISKGVGKTVAILTLYSFYPLEIFRQPIINWSTGSSEAVKESVDYFRINVEGTLGRYYIPRTLAPEFLEQIETEVLLVVGTQDALVGNPEDAIKYASSMPNLSTEVLESSHLINVEKADESSDLMFEFFR